MGCGRDGVDPGVASWVLPPRPRVQSNPLWALTPPPHFSSHFSSLLFSVARAGATPDPGSSKYEYEYEEEACIGSGSFGEVFRVRGRRDQQLYAIKKSKPFTGKADKSVPPPSLLSLSLFASAFSLFSRERSGSCSSVDPSPETRTGRAR